jgi:pyruvate formate lyase activating enzyme
MPAIADTASRVAATTRPAAPVGRIAGTLTSSLVDGPGNRFVVFCQGCNLDCLACHNPTTIPGWTRQARLRSVDDLLAEVRRVAPFLSGITVSGGEPTLQLDFLVALLTRLKGDAALGHLTTLVDSNGTLPIDGWERLAPCLDGAMIDLKAADPDLHRRLTGHGSTAVVESLRWLSRHDLLTEVRLLVIPGVTDTPGHLARYAAVTGGIDPGVPLRLMGFRHRGVRAAGRRWREADADDLDRVAAALARHGMTGVLPR